MRCSQSAVSLVWPPSLELWSSSVSNYLSFLFDTKERAGTGHGWREMDTVVTGFPFVVFYGTLTLLTVRLRRKLGQPLFDRSGPYRFLFPNILFGLSIGVLIVFVGVLRLVF